ncbi:S8 family serine peptidase [Streptomyces sp. NPDC057280]|uniref:cyanobactin maturation protease PatG family protein n=1 Tax=Streptomyces sp. NPDC057280 TaxID=3346081 RepID=UPI0036334A71
MDARSVLQGLQLPQHELLGDPAVCIAVLDGPVDLSHPCFEGADLTRLDTLVQEPAGQGLMSLHGTHVASLIFGQSDRTVMGVAPRCRGLILPVFPDAEGSRVPQLDLARAIEQAVEAGAHIINISGGERAPDGQLVSMLERALRMCDDRGVLVVAAVGNDGCDCLHAPAAAPSVLAVGASDVNGQPMAFNNWGAAYRRNGVIAPGQDIEGAAVGGGVRTLTGSSFATPIVSGVAALLVAAQLRLKRHPDPKAAGQAILTSATAPRCYPEDAPHCRRHLVGRLDAARAHQLITGGGTMQTAVQRRQDRASNQPGDTPKALNPQAYTKDDTDEGAEAMEAIQPNAGAPQETAAVSEGASAAMSTPQPDPDPGAAAAPPSAEDPAAGVLPACACGCGGADTCAQAQGPQASAAGQAGPGSDVTYAEGTPAPVGGSAGAGLGTVLPPGPSPVGGVAGQGAGVRPACGFGDGGTQRPLVYAIGNIGFDFRTEATRDSFRQQMPPHLEPDPGPDGRPVYRDPNPYDPLQLRNYLAANPWASDKLTWTLEIGRTPVYALEAELPAGMDWGGPTVDLEQAKALAHQAAQDQEKLAQLLLDHSLQGQSYPPVSRVYKIFRDAIWGQIRDVPLAPPDAEGQPHGISDARNAKHGAIVGAKEHAPRDYISQVSVPGVLTGETVRLYSGQKVPKVRVDGRGLATWNETALINAVMDEILPTDGPAEIATDRMELERTLRAFLDKIYYQFRNLGQSSADRALNYAGTNAFQLGNQIKDGLLSAKYTPGVKDDHLYTLDTITVKKSPYQRMDSDCQDVIVSFIDPENDRRAKVSYLFTVDVNATVPVSLAPPHTFLGEF